MATTDATLTAAGINVVTVTNPDNPHGAPAYDGDPTLAHTRLDPGMYPASGYDDNAAPGTDPVVDVVVWVAGGASGAVRTDRPGAVIAAAERVTAFTRPAPVGPVDPAGIVLAYNQVLATVTDDVHSRSTGFGTVHFDADALDDDSLRWVGYFVWSTLQSLTRLYGADVADAVKGVRF